MTPLTAILLSSVMVSSIWTSPVPTPVDPGVMNSMLSSLLTMSNGMYSMMVQAMIDAKIADSSSSTPAMTIMLVPNDVYRTMTTTDMGKMMVNNPEMMKKLMMRHINMNRKIMPNDIQNDMVVQSMSGEKIRFNIYGGKIMTANGMVMTMDQQTMLPNCVVYRLSGPIMSSMAPGLMSLLNMNRDKFSTLIQAVQTAGLSDTLETGGPFTLFAPTNDAFKLSPNLSSLMSNPADLKKLLLGHVAQGVSFTPGLMNMSGMDLKMLSGDSNKIMTQGNAIQLDKANLMTDSMGMVMPMIADNGALYTIDRVLMN